MPQFHKPLLIGFVLLFCHVLAFGQEKASSPETVKELQTAVEKVLKNRGSVAVGEMIKPIQIGSGIYKAS